MTETANTPPTSQNTNGRGPHPQSNHEELWMTHDQLMNRQMALERELSAGESPTKRAELMTVNIQLGRVIDRLYAGGMAERIYD